MPTTDRVAELEQENAQLCANLTSLNAEYTSLKRQLEWFKRQLFGSKSEKRLDIDPAVQGNLLAGLGVVAPPPKDTPKETITYQRRKKTRGAAVNDSGLRFDDSVPVQTINVSDPAIDATARGMPKRLQRQSRSPPRGYQFRSTPERCSAPGRSTPPSRRSKEAQERE